VEGPLVDYGRLARLRGELDRYLSTLAATSPTTIEAMPPAERLAFWINAYNACMLKIVVDHYPLGPEGLRIIERLRNRLAGYPESSVWQIPGVFSREHCTVAGEERSQDEIEHEIIRPAFAEPRIHFAVNCAARSCPVLWPEAYEGARIDDQLERAVWKLIASPQHFRLERGSPATLRLNRVLDWYRDDFGGIEGLKAFFAVYLPARDRAFLLQPDTRVEFFEYDWTLNEADR
jgi:hypothetical protein